MAYYGITNESQIIDISTISNGCQKIRDAATHFTQSAQRIRNASDLCTVQALSVDNTTMQPRLDSDADYIASIEKAIGTFTAQIESVALQIHRIQQDELYAYRTEQARLAAENNNG